MLLRPDLLLRLESLLILVAAVGAYRLALHAGWGLFFALLLAPDLSLLVYAVRRSGRLPAGIYNCAHSYLLPGALLLIALAEHERPLLAAIALIWISHIGLDRLLGFGLKYAEAFQPTHLQAAARFPKGI